MPRQRVDRRTGGLEKYRMPVSVLDVVDRRTGGLEKLITLLREDLFC